MAYPSIERPKPKKDFESPLSPQGRSKAAPWWADAYDKGTLTAEQERLIMAGKADLAKEIQIKADKAYKDAAGYETLGKAVEVADTAITVGSLATPVGWVKAGGKQLLKKTAKQTAKQTAKNSTKVPMSKRKIIKSIFNKITGKGNKPKPNNPTSSKPPKTGTAPKGKSPYKPSSTGSASKNPYNKPSSTSKPKDNVRGTGASGYNKPTAGASPKTPPTTGAKIKGAGKNILDVVAPTTGSILKTGYGAAKKVAPVVFPATSKVLKTAVKVADRAAVPAAVIYGGKKIYDAMSGDESSEAVEAETEGSKNLGGSGMQGPTIEELLRGASPEQRAAYYKGKAGEDSGTATSPEESASNEAINDALRDQIFGPTTDNRPTSSFFTSGDEPKTTATTRSGSGSDPDSELSYLRSRKEVKEMDRAGKADIAEKQRANRLKAEANFRDRKDFIETGRALNDTNIIKKDGQELGRVIKDSTGRIIGHSLNKAGRAAMGNRKGAGVIDGSMRDTALGLDKRDEQIAGMRGAQKDVANLFYSGGGGSRSTGSSSGSGSSVTPKAISIMGPSDYSTPKATAVNTPTPSVMEVGITEGQGGYGLPAPNTTDVPNAPRATAVNTQAPRATAVNTQAPRATAVNTQAPKAIPVVPKATAVNQTPTDADLNNKFSSMPKEGNQVIPVDSAGAVVPANVTANSYNWEAMNLPEGSTNTPPTDMSRAEYPFDKQGQYDTTAVAGKPKTPPIGSLVTNLLNQKKKNKR